MSESYTDADLRAILERTRTIAVVGVSMNPVRPSAYVTRYLALKSYRVIPVNPGHAGATVQGETVRAGLSEIAEPVDMVDIFRTSRACARSGCRSASNTPGPPPRPARAASRW
jgi:predicted CoA-binding protein